MSQEADIDPHAPEAPPRGHFWRGPVTNEIQAEDIIEWSACANLLLAIFISALGFWIEGKDPQSLTGMIAFPLFVGFPSPFLWLLRSRFAAALSLILHGLLLYLTLWNSGFSNPVEAKLILGSIFVILLILDWRGFRAAWAWQRMKKGRRIALAAVFE